MGTTERLTSHPPPPPPPLFFSSSPSSSPSLLPSPSALQRLLKTHPPPPQTAQSRHALALQIAHNLRFQHAWTELRLHYTLPSSSSASSASPSPPLSSPTEPLAQPLLSGRPPRRLYVHPDEQIEQLQRQKERQRRKEQRERERERQEGESGGRGQDAEDEDEDEDEAGEDAVGQSEREWVLPSQLRERWSLRRFGEAFDAISGVPGRKGGGGVELFVEEKVEEGEEEGEERENPWRASQPKRLLLATLDDDSTVVYYIVHDGVVKPRQN